MARHPWEITPREFVEKVRHDYGIELSLTSVTLAASLIEGKGRLYPLPVLGADDVLPLDVLRTLCRAFNLPPMDFHLDPEDD